MALIKGIDVVLYTRIQVGIDGFGTPIWEEKPEIVSNVLVYPASSEDITNSTSLYGKHAVYTLGIPKTDNHQWEDTTVEFFGRKWKTFGFLTKGIDELIPLEWNGKIQVEMYDN